MGLGIHISIKLPKDADTDGPDPCPENHRLGRCLASLHPASMIPGFLTFPFRSHLRQGVALEFESPDSNPPDISQLCDLGLGFRRLSLSSSLELGDGSDSVPHHLGR